MDISDEESFTASVERHRPELRVHCYRMLGSLDDAEDLVQETFLRAWRGRETYAGRSSVRAWLYRIATNACLDALAKLPHNRQVARGTPAPTEAGDGSPPAGSGGAPVAAAVRWLQPYPDAWLENLPSFEAEPDAVVVGRETIELAFLAAIQHLPPRQRAALILRDVLGWSARQTADALEISVAAANSALQRARPALRAHLPARRADWTAPAAGDEERAVVRRYMEALTRADDAALARLLHADAQVSQRPGAGGNMTAEIGWYAGRDTVIAAWAPVLHGPDAAEFRLVPTGANRQPALAFYLRPRGSDEPFRPFGLTVLRVEDGLIAEITVFGPELFASFGLAERA